MTIMYSFRGMFNLNILMKYCSKLKNFSDEILKFEQYASFQLHLYTMNFCNGYKNLC